MDILKTSSLSQGFFYSDSLNLDICVAIDCQKLYLLTSGPCAPGVENCMNGRCLCKSGYEGSNCCMCQEGFTKTENGTCAGLLLV